MDDAETWNDVVAPHTIPRDLQPLQVQAGEIDAVFHGGDPGTPAVTWQCGTFTWTKLGL